MQQNIELGYSILYAVSSSSTSRWSWYWLEDDYPILQSIPAPSWRRILFFLCFDIFLSIKKIRKKINFYLIYFILQDRLTAKWLHHSVVSARTCLCSVPNGSDSAPSYYCWRTCTRCSTHTENSRPRTTDPASARPHQTVDSPVWIHRLTRRDQLDVIPIFLLV